MESNEIRKEFLRIKKIFNGIDKNKKNFVMPLIERLAYLNVTVKYLERDIAINGTMIPYQNGENQSGMRKNPDVDTYTNYTKIITTITKQLIELVPASQKESKLSALLND